MDFQLESEHMQIRDTVIKFVANEVAPYAEEWEKDEVFPREVIRKMGSLGVSHVSKSDNEIVRLR